MSIPVMIPLPENNKTQVIDVSSSAVTQSAPTTNTVQTKPTAMECSWYQSPNQNQVCQLDLTKAAVGVFSLPMKFVDPMLVSVGVDPGLRGLIGIGVSGLFWWYVYGQVKTRFFGK
jgi:hypothetical protein